MSVDWGRHVRPSWALETVSLGLLSWPMRSNSYLNHPGAFLHSCFLPGYHHAPTTVLLCWYCVLGYGIITCPKHSSLSECDELSSVVVLSVQNKLYWFCILIISLSVAIYIRERKQHLHNYTFAWCVVSGIVQ